MTQVQLSFIAMCVVFVLLMAAIYYGFYRFLKRPQRDEEGRLTSQWDVIFGIDTRIDVSPEGKTLGIKHRDIESMRAVVVALFVLILFLSGVFVYTLIGFPVRPPVFRIGQTELVIGKTTVRDLMQEGYVLYLKNTDTPDTIRAERGRSTVVLGLYTPQKRTITFTCKHETSAENSDLALVKDGIVVAFVNLYPEEGETSPLERCAIKELYMYESNLAALQKAHVDVSVDRVLLTDFHRKQFEATFGKRIWLYPSYADHTRTNDSYCVAKTSISDGLFWNRYNFCVKVNPTGTVVTGFELNCRYRKDKEE
ncbi:hypothetical protein HMPREF0663_10741 [Hoylesella oralis ATCC 33269]|uniref:Uncharacterized protein n=1 Tax=Hoylesella oralis ATCC 33269 TaxID=873533 RepID=E7RNJ0_9BACT|nr:hypothetical protein [Hoylesella oralis]EFZ37283.1 hypothetical protein HMPREF0663_10741 [Hoylesella oralis ATCC 33269]EPH15076.1 hypothetical protein HMPREF1475_02261 [Hoylesella oralis HGA0225]SHG06736.1 hypothetical protein SAMN05444288_2263 [Hoylesella oralis]